MSRSRITLIVLLATGLAAGHAAGQLGPAVRALETPAQKPVRPPRPPRLTAAEQLARDADRTFAKLRDCRDVERLPARFRTSAYASRIANARARFCPMRVETVESAPSRAPLSPALPPPTPIDGNASTGRNPIEFIIGNRTVRLAGVVGCHPDNDRRELTRLLTHVLVCRPLGAAYQCSTKDTNVDVARAAVENGNAQPTGEDYENEYYSWKRAVEAQASSSPRTKYQCLGGR